MTKVLLGSLVAAMLALTGLVAYNTVTTPDAPVCPGTAAGDEGSCCESEKTPCPLCAADASTGCAAQTTTAEAPPCKEGATAKPGCCAEGAAATATAPAEAGTKKDGDAGAQKD